MKFAEQNYCRNPSAKAKDGSDMTGPWCYYMKGSTIAWDYCDVPKCASRATDEVNCIAKCCYTGAGQDYKGTENSAKNNKTCIFWETLKDTKWNARSKYMKFAEQNYCRNPSVKAKDGSDMKGPWCYYMNGKTIAWDYCDVSKCASRETDKVNCLD